MAEPDPSETLAKKRVGHVVGGKWRLERLLGMGGMAAVYRATHTNNLKAVAVKMLHADLGAHGELKKRFLREGYIANKVGHPGAVSVLDDGVDDDGSAYLVMELLEGETLSERAAARGGRLAPKEVLALVDSLLDVLVAAHAQQVIHRDLKPDNVFVTKVGEPKILDFGIARAQEAAAEQTQAGVVMGTPEYMPPEQARGRVDEIDGRADLFAVGAMMFRLLAGRCIHDAETSNETLLLAMTVPAPKLGDALRDAPTDVAAIVDKALAFEKADRFADAHAMQLAVRAVRSAIEATDQAVPVVAEKTPLGPEGATGDVPDARARGEETVAPPVASSKTGASSSTVVPTVEPARRSGSWLPLFLSLGAIAGASYVAWKLQMTGALPELLAQAQGGVVTSSVAPQAASASAIASSPAPTPVAVAVDDAGSADAADAGELADADVDDADIDDDDEAPLPADASTPHRVVTSPTRVPTGKPATLPSAQKKKPATTKHTKTAPKKR